MAEAEAGAGLPNSDWMSRLPEQLQHVCLWNLAIPAPHKAGTSVSACVATLLKDGSQTLTCEEAESFVPLGWECGQSCQGSHDTMSYDLDINSSIMEPDQLRPMSNVPCVRHLVYSWAQTQEVNICKQLDEGVRFFDLRIAHKESDPTRLYFYHGLSTRSDVETVLRAVNDWAGRHPKEILILALSHFKETKEQVHEKLINFIKTLFGEKLLPRTEGQNHPTLKSCWDSGRHVIISDSFSMNNHPELWKSITYFYGNTMVPSKVRSALDDKLRDHRPDNVFFVCGLNLTLPENLEALKHVVFFWRTFKVLILKSLPELLDWTKAQTPGAGDMRVNIIASDLVDKDDFSSTVIKLNDKILHR